MAKDSESLRDQINIIGSGTTIKGDIDCNGDMRIDGKVTGTQTVHRDTPVMLYKFPYAGFICDK